MWLYPVPGCFFPSQIPPNVWFWLIQWIWWHLPSKCCKGYLVIPPRCPADMPFWVMTVGLSLHYSDSIWQGVLSHLKRLFPLKSQVLSAHCSHPQIAGYLRQPRCYVSSVGEKVSTQARRHSHPSRCSCSICRRVQREYFSLSSFLSPSEQPFMSDRIPDRNPS